ncbi:DUF4287 domain-containing protein [Streptomyces flavotricini]|uniref:DUF4287 domain-containing protein n=1 Tax=Streptomyces flavotricini TaxID=66888 RepID=UPI001E653646|nr:DUF4287 domain-containing protein [Streptomyces flavotricini]
MARPGREVSDWLRAVDDGPSLVRFEEKVSWLRGAHAGPHGRPARPDRAAGPKRW